MSNLQRMDNLKAVVSASEVEREFATLAKIHGAVHWPRELSFALHILKENSYLAQVAMGNPDSLKHAVISVAAVGISLNPVEKLAYLVPRDSKVCLDISYRGYLKIATDSGAIKWAVAELVYEKDLYAHKGVGKEPVHEFHPFGDRGKLLGGYVLAKTHDGEFIITHMSLADVYAIRDRSMSWRAYVKDQSKKSPWNTDEGEMIKKTIIRRAVKMWPLTDTRDSRLANAIDVSDQADPIELSGGGAPQLSSGGELAGLLTEIRTALTAVGRTEEKLVEHLARVNRRELKSLEDLTEIEAQQALAFLKQMQVTSGGTPGEKPGPNKQAS